MKDFLWVVLVSMVPMVELRGAIPIGCGLGLPAWQVYIAAVLGNLIPVPFIILFVRPVFAFIRKHWKWLGGIVDKIENRAGRNVPRVQKFQVLGLFLFVAVPIPGTGAWMGSLIAALLDVRLRRAFPTILLGLLVAGAVMIAVSYGVRFGVQAIT